MSRIYFHSEHATAEVYGPERAYAGNLCSGLALGVLPLDDYPSSPAPIRRLVPKSSYVHEYTGHYFQSHFETWFRVGMSDAYFELDGARHDTFTLGLNTAYVLGGDAVKLLARLHGQCEIHVYVEGPHRAWLADIIARGRETKILRPEMGWESVIDLLRARDDEPVVTSYSVCDGFPNQGIARAEGVWESPALVREDADGDDEDAYDDDAWYDLPYEEQWRVALQALRAQNARRPLELTPEIWDTFYFGSGVTAFDVVDALALVEA